jgi:hypothetical protein
VLPGFGFNAGGRIAWIGEGHDEWAHQRDKESRFKKSEVYEKLLKSTRAGEEIFHKLLPRYEDNGKRYKFRSKPSKEWASGPPLYTRPEHALYWGLMHPDFVKYYRKLSPKKRAELDDKLENHYSPPGKHRAEIDALLDKHVPGWKTHNPREFDTPHPRLVDAVSNGDLSINVPSESLRGIMREGRWRNLFETGDGMGNTDPGVRAMHEREKLGISSDLVGDNDEDEFLSGEKRPVYGWLNFGKHLFGANHGEHGVKQYGDVVVKLKPHVKKRATLTVGDSFSVEPKHVFLADKHAKQVATRLMEYSEQGPAWNAVARGEVSHVADEDGKPLPSVGRSFLEAKHPNRAYVEAQIHGGVYPKTDVASIHYDPNHDGRSRALAFGKHFGVPVYKGETHLVWHPSMEEPKEEPKLEPKLEKSLKGAVAGLTFGLAAAMAPSPTSQPPQMEQPGRPLVTAQVPPKQQRPALHPHLKAISFLESSGGLKMDHHPDPRGEWWTAHGHLGFKPAVAHEFYKKNKGLQKQFPGLTAPDLFLHDFKSDPVLYDSVANEYWKDLLSKAKQPGLAAFKWRNGRYANQAGWRNHEYVQRFDNRLAPMVAAKKEVPWLDSTPLAKNDLSFLEP